jgi:predicted Zn-dependent protease
MTNAGKVTEADTTAEKWLRDHPKDVVLHAFLAEHAMRLQDYKSAARHYQAILASQPDNPLILNNVAWATGELGDPKALSYAEKAFALAPNNAAILDTLGVLLVKRGDLSQGLKSLQQAAQLAPNQSDIRLHLAKALIKAGDRDAARKELGALTQASSQSPDVMPSGNNGPTTDQPSTTPAGSKKPSLTCGPECASEAAALLKTL